MMTQETAEFYGSSQLAERGISHLSDNVILLNYVFGSGELTRALTILKTRGDPHDQSIHHYTITEDGMAVGEPVSGQLDVKPSSEAPEGPVNCSR